MSHRLWMFGTLAAAGMLAGCSSSGALSRYTYDSPQTAGTYLDGTGPTADAAEEAETRRETARQAQSAPVRRAPATRRAEDLSARTTGSRAQPGGEPPKPYSEEWWDREKREDSRLKQKMIICQGC